VVAHAGVVGVGIRAGGPEDLPAACALWFRASSGVLASDVSVQRFYAKRGWVFTGQVETSPDGEEEMVFVVALS